MEYICIKGFSIDICDGDGFVVEQNGMSVEPGEAWFTESENVGVIGGYIRLETADGGRWIEITEDMLDTYFKEG